IIKELKEVLKAPSDLTKSVEALLQERIELRKELEGLYNQQMVALKRGLKEQAESRKGGNLIIAKVHLPSADALKKLAYELKNEMDTLVAVLAAEIEGKPQIAVIIDEELIASKGYNASQIVRELAKAIQGGG